MAQIDIGEAATAGVNLVFRKPLVVLTWGLVVVAYVVLLLVLFGGGMIAMIGPLLAAGAKPAPAQIIGMIGGFIGFYFLFLIGMLVLGAMVSAAAIRAELEPDNVGFAYLRLGRQELWLIAVNFVQGLLLGVIQIVLSIPLTILSVAMTVGIAGGGTEHDGGALAVMVLVRFLGQLVVIGVTFWVWIRLSLGPVLSYRDREFRLFESWAMTKGHALQMFLAMLLVVLIGIALYVVVSIIGAAGVFGFIAATPALRNPQALFQGPPGVWLSALGPIIVFVALLMVVVFGVINALTWTTVARMYKQLNPDADIASNFA
ncbi:MAG TPA: hypothetical protein VG939_19365 [Caulobacteraceae bacterium]|nr:hypothetical protein [Caulobacteraceae bacterium]